MKTNPVIQRSLLNIISYEALLDIHAFVQGWKTSAYIPLPSEWASENRYLPAGTTEFPGLIDHSIAPHMVEIQDAFHPDSGIQQGSIMKGTQSLATTALENVIGHSIKYKLHNILYIISSKNIAGIRSSAAIDVMIDSSGLGDCVKPISQRMKRKTADNKYYKELHGGRRLMLTSWNSIGDAKSLSWDLIIMDEIDESPYELKGQGDPEKIFAGRGKTVRNLKIAKISTPTSTATSKIYRNFLEGDQRYFNCQCPFCGERHVLTLKAGGIDYGLTARSEIIDKVEQIIPETVIYICKICKKEIKEFQKQDMLTGGLWTPTARPINPAYRSWQVSNLISPIMFYTWRQAMQEFCETEWGQKITHYKNFVIDVMGQPWEARAEKKSWQVVKSKAEDYPLGEVVPEGGVIITGGVDVQKNRVEFGATAWGRDMESWKIDYKVFFGETKSRGSQVWVDLKNYILSKKYKLRDRMIPIAITAIDTGYNPKIDKLDVDTDITIEHVVYDFIARTPRTIACRGNSDLKDMILKEERVKRKSLLKRRYDVAINELKDETFIKLDYGEDTPGRIHFSNELPDEYFKGFVSEVFAEIAPGKWEWKKIFERNEPLDVYILCRAAAERLNLPTWTPQVWIEFEKKLFNKR